MSKQTGIKIHINWTYVLMFGLWDAAWNIIWGVYNNYLPVFWQSGNPNYNVLGSSAAVGFGLGAFFTGLIMSLDNVASVIMQPIFGALNDRAKSRKQIVIIAGALPAVFFALIPFVFMSIPPEKSGHIAELIIPFVLVITLAAFMILSWGASKGSEAGLRYAIIPSAVMTQVYSYTAVFGGIAFIATFMGSNLLYKINPGLPFWVGSGFLALTVLGYAIFIKEPKNTTLTSTDIESAGEKTATGFKAIWDGLKLLSPELKRAFFIIAGTKFLGWAGVAGLETFGSSYSVNVLGLDESQAGMMSAIYFVGYLFFAVPSGYLAARFGRKNMLKIALIGFIVAGLTQFIFGSLSTAFVVLILAGAANVTIDVMCTPMVTDVAPSKKIVGTVVSLFSAVTTLASVCAVPLWGALIQATGNNFSLLWLGLAIMPALGFILISTLKPGIGEAKPVTIIDEANW